MLSSPRRGQDTPELTAPLRAFLAASEARAAALAHKEQARHVQRERYDAERERVRDAVRRAQRRWLTKMVGRTVAIVLWTTGSLWGGYRIWQDLIPGGQQLVSDLEHRQTGDNSGAWTGLIGRADAFSRGASMVLRGNTGPLDSTAFSPNGKLALAGSDDQTARLWDTATGKAAATLGEHTGAVAAVAFSPDGRRVLTGSDDQTAQLWDVANGKLLTAFDGHRDRITAVAFSPDGKEVLTGSADDTARLWEAATGVVAASFAGDTGPITTVAFSPDGTHVLTGSEDATARLWDAATGERLVTLAGHTGAVTSVAFSPAGSRAVTGSVHHTARVWAATWAGHAPEDSDAAAPHHSQPEDQHASRR